MFILQYISKSTGLSKIGFESPDKDLLVGLANIFINDDDICIIYNSITGLIELTLVGNGAKAVVNHSFDGMMIYEAIH